MACGQPGDAVEMYVQQGDYDSAARLAQQWQLPSLFDILAAQVCAHLSSKFCMPCHPCIPVCELLLVAILNTENCRVSAVSPEAVLHISQTTYEASSCFSHFQMARRWG